MAHARRLFVLAAFPLASLIPLLVRAADQPSPWREINSPHFAIVTDAGEKRGRELALRLEQMRAVFASLLLRQKMAQPVPLQVIALKDDDAFVRLAPQVAGKPISLTGFVLRNEDRDFVVLNLSAAEPWRAVAHDLAEIWLDGNYPTTDPWLDEGIAEYLASIHVDDKQVEIGADPEASGGHSLTSILQTSRWIAFSDFLRMQRAGAETTHLTLFHAQSWATVHYLLAQKKMTEVGAYFDLVKNQNQPVDQALQQALKLTTAQLEQAVTAHFKALPPPQRYALPVDPDSTALVVHVLSELEAHCLIAEAEVHVRPDQAVADAQAQVKLFPESGSPYRVLALVALQKKDLQTALEDFNEAIEANPKDMWSRYYAAAARVRDAQASGEGIHGLANTMQELRSVLEWYPEFANAYYLLGLARLEGGGTASAVEAATAAIRLGPRNQRYQLALARIYTEGKKFDAAQELLDRLKTSADPQIAADAAQAASDLALIRKYGIAPKRTAAAAKAPPPMKLEEEQRPPEEPPPDTRKTQFAKGRILSVDCSQAPKATITLATGNRVLKLHVADTKSLLLIGSDSFSCSWKGQHATANFKAGTGNEGDLVSLEVEN
jgi:tetratricopeptide (TPR) repeat protein